MSTNDTTEVLSAMTGAMDSGSHLLGVTPPEWVAAVVAAIVIAIVWDLFMAATRRITKRVPFLVLRLARLGMSRDEWKQLYEGEWKPELHACLTDPGCGPASRFLQAMAFAIPLAVGGARMTAVAKRQPRRRFRDWVKSIQSWTLLRITAYMMTIAATFEAAAASLGLSETTRLITFAVAFLVLPLLLRVIYLVRAERRRRAASKK
ncbi:hypothetical protein [Streptomyces sp. NPDC048248]|uniref:hypothetical protein n=1 Tax=Streptomyces sp. NPDC048248 TaxID=3365523 RepID=UPI00371246FB